MIGAVETHAGFVKDHQQQIEPSRSSAARCALLGRLFTRAGLFPTLIGARKAVCLDLIPLPTMFLAFFFQTSLLGYLICATPS
jgi:hypothetical protein